METVDIRCPKSMLNVAKRAKKGKNRYISGFSERSGHGTIQFISIEPNSHEPFNTATLRRLKKQNTCGQISFDHMLSHRHGRYRKIKYFISGYSAVW